MGACRRKDADFERRDCGFLCDLRSDWRGRGRGRAFGVHRSRRAGGRRGADRGDRPAPARAPQVRQCPNSGLCDHRRARRALDEALSWAKSRRLGTGTLADNGVTQAKLADMALLIDASALLIYRSAWQQDEGGADNRRAAAMAKLHATEAAQHVIDAAVQMHGGAGVTKGVKVEELYRDIRAL